MECVELFSKGSFIARPEWHDELFSCLLIVDARRPFPDTFCGQWSFFCKACWAECCKHSQGGQQEDLFKSFAAEVATLLSA